MITLIGQTLIPQSKRLKKVDLQLRIAQQRGDNGTKSLSQFRAAAEEYPDETWNSVMDVDPTGTSIMTLAMGKPAEVADSMVVLASNVASYIAGHNVIVDSGFGARLAVSKPHTTRDINECS